jgi:DNA-binding IclR family transcriptional regulator
VETTGFTVPAAVDTVLAVVRRHPGLTCEDIAAFAGMSTASVKPILAVLAARGFLVKTGRTRGTRYAPPEGATTAPSGDRRRDLDSDQD